MAHFEVRGKGHFEVRVKFAAVRHPWLISGGGLPETRGGFSAKC